MEKASSGELILLCFKQNQTTLSFVQRRPTGRSEPIAINCSGTMKISYSEPMTSTIPRSGRILDFHPLGIHNRDHRGKTIFVTSE
jgi:hypothetical protein